MKPKAQYLLKRSIKLITPKSDWLIKRKQSKHIAIIERDITTDSQDVKESGEEPRKGNPLSVWCCATFTRNSHWGRAATGIKKCWVYAHRVASVVSDYLRPCTVVSLSETGFSRQKYWSVLVDTGCHTLLEHCISCCPSLQPPWVAGAARNPATQAAAPPPHLTLTGANPSLRS